MIPREAVTTGEFVMTSMGLNERLLGRDQMRG